ncbi:MAG: tRNA pseudouridine(55) synthase TruB [Tepidisphaeraceae bacterium]|jgi:tRNA pseudouridine55 synthase
MDGMINLDKPAGISSAAAVSRVKRLLPRGTKIGHAGTLDPFATGVLLLLIGKATKACEMLMAQPKRYETTAKMGATTATDDRDSPEIPAAIPRQPSRAEIEQAAAAMVGTIQQRPPIYSALKIAGHPAYELARSGKPVNLEPRSVRVDAIEILSWQWPLLRMRIDCGRGTYVRAIARDLGEALKCGGYLTELRRTRIGSFDIAQAVTLEQLIQQGIAPYLQPISLPHPQNPQQGRQND